VSALQAGDKLPNVELYENSPTNKVSLSDLTKGKKVVIFAVPGAFTPGCSKVSVFSDSVALCRVKKKIPISQTFNNTVLETPY
jgi:2-Cys peroxiredoxin 5